MADGVLGAALGGAVMSAREVEEWCFEFSLLPGEEGGSVPYGVAEELMVQVILPWARAPRYTIGGGFRPAGEWWRPRAGEWGYKFGLAITEADQIIPERDAVALMSVVTAFATSHGARVEGGYREFTEDDGIWPTDLEVEEDGDAGSRPGDS